jgi:hypothetical protein
MLPFSCPAVPRLLPFSLAVALASVAVSSLAATSTTRLRLESNLGALSAKQRTVSVAILGLNASGNTDLYGSAGGSTLVAEVSSVLGTVNGGDAVPATSQTAGNFANGGFAASIRYVGLSAGVGKVNVSYPANVSGNDTITVRLLEVRSAGGTGASVNTTVIDSRALTSSVQPQNSVAGVLNIESFVLNSTATGDTLGLGGTTASVLATLGIDSTDAARITAGYAGAQYVIKAYKVENDSTFTFDSLASGPVTLELNGSRILESLGGNLRALNTRLTIPGQMVDGVATVTLPASITRAGVYRVVARLGQLTSEPGNIVGVIGTGRDQLTVYPRSTPVRLALELDSESAGGMAGVIARSPDPISANSGGAGETDRFSARPVFRVSLLDEFNNAVNANGVTAPVTVRISDANNKVPDFNITIAASTNNNVRNLSGNRTDLVDTLFSTANFSSGTAALTATVTGSSSAIAASNVVNLRILGPTQQLCFADSNGGVGGSSQLLASFSATAGFTISAFAQNRLGYTSAGDSTVCAGLPSGTRLTVQQPGNAVESRTFVYDTAASNMAVLFNRRFTNSEANNQGFLLGDTDGRFGEFRIQPAMGQVLKVFSATAVQARLYPVNYIVSAGTFPLSPNPTLDPHPPTTSLLRADRQADGRYTLVFQPRNVRIFDTFNNSNSDDFSASLRTFTLSSAKGVVTTTGTLVAQDSTNSATITYPASITGTDTLTFSFPNAPGITLVNGAGLNSVTVNFPAADPALASFDAVTSSTDIPVNAVIPLSLRPLAADGAVVDVVGGYLLNFPNALQVRNADASTTYSSGQNLIGAGARQLGLQTVSVEAGSVPGRYTLTVVNTAGTISKDIVLKVTEWTPAPVDPALTPPDVNITIPDPAQPNRPSISAGIALKSADAGLPGAVFVLATLTLKDGSVVLVVKTPAGWQLFDPASKVIPFLSAANLSTVSAVDVLAGIDLTGLKAVTFYVGYGAGLPFGTGLFASMLAGRTYRAITTINPQ